MNALNILLALLLWPAPSMSAQVPRAPINLHLVAAGKLLYQGDLAYQGAFRLPQGASGGSSFDYGGTALSFNPARGSLFVVGHDWQQQVAEIGVPEVRQGSTIAALATAVVLQPFVDVTEGRMRLVDPSGPTIKVGGTLPYAGRLLLTAYVYYDGNGTQSLSHVTAGLNFSIAGTARGPFRVGTLGAGFVSGYFALIPAEWQSALGGPVMGGQCCLSIISRTSYGPSAFAIDPAQLGVVDPLPATPLLYYTGAHPLGPYDGQSLLFNGSTVMAGAVFPEGTRSILFFGKQGVGPLCYGEGTSDASRQGQPTGDGSIWCYDPTAGGKGYHAYPFESRVWAYDALDLAAVKSGSRQPWDVKPYAVWSFSLPFGGQRILGAAYDAKTGRIFLSQEYGDDARPLVHVLSVMKPS